MDRSQDSDVARLGELIDDIDVAMLTTVEEDGTLRSRPMMTQKTPFDGTLWFFTRVHSSKVNEVSHDRHVSVAYANAGNGQFVSVSGVARIVQDPAQARELWDPLYQAWFAQGLEDPEISLIRVDVTKAETWDRSGAVTTLVGFGNDERTMEAVETAPPGLH